MQTHSLGMLRYRPTARLPCGAANRRPDGRNRLANHIRKIRSLAPPDRGRSSNYSSDDFLELLDPSPFELLLVFEPLELLELLPLSSEELVLEVLFFLGLDSPSSLDFELSFDVLAPLDLFFDLLSPPPSPFEAVLCFPVSLCSEALAAFPLLPFSPVPFPVCLLSFDSFGFLSLTGRTIAGVPLGTRLTRSIGLVGR